MKFSSVQISSVFIVCLVSVTLQIPSFGQFALPPGNPVLPQDDSEQLQKQQYEQQIELRIDEIHQVCDLDDAQLKKLRTAAKGAVLHAMTEWKKQHNNMAIGFGPAVNRIRIAAPALAAVPAFAEPIEPQEPRQKPDERDEPAPPEEDEFAPVDVVPILPAANVVFANPPLQMFAASSRSVEEQKIWKHTVTSVLTTEQLEKLSDADNDRRRFLRESRVRDKVIQLDQQLRLSPKQREQVVDIVDRVLGPTFETENSTNGMSISFGDQPTLMFSHMKDILTPTQATVFKQATVNAGLFPAFRFEAIAPPVMFFRGADDNRAFFGASFNPAIGQPQDGVIIQKIVPDGPADQAGLVSGDTLLKFDNNEVPNAGAIINAVGQKEPGDKVKVVYKRDGAEKEVTVTLEARQ